MTASSPAPASVQGQHQGQDQNRGQGAGMAAGLAAVIMWGLAPVATRALVGHLAPIPLLVLRIGLSGLVLLPWCAHRLIRMRRGGTARLSRGRLTAAGLLCMVGYNLPVTVGLQWVPASTAALILATEPVWILALGRIFLRTPCRRCAGPAPQ
jgi:drug/metabolite transporter (DMT)-like permease